MKKKTIEEIAELLKRRDSRLREIEKISDMERRGGYIRLNIETIRTCNLRSIILKDFLVDGRELLPLLFELAEADLNEIEIKLEAHDVDIDE